MKHIEQLFILTHNVYFYKEVSFDKRPICSQRQHFNVIKSKNKSSIIGKGRNAFIKSDYALLWDSLSELRESESILLSISIFNIIRRILESYISFTFGNNKKDWEVLKSFEENSSEYYIVYALLSEINVSSHSTFPLDSIHYQKVITHTPVEIFNCFRLIFKEIGEGHYEMMMNKH